MLAKLHTKNDEKYFQTLNGHTMDALKISKCYIDKNYLMIEDFCDHWGIDASKFLRSVFTAVYLHDVGKLTSAFQKNIEMGKHSQRAPHAFFSVPIISKLDTRFFSDLQIETCAVLGHHTQLYNQMYSNVRSPPEYIRDEINTFLENGLDAYNTLGFNRYFGFDGFSNISIENSRPMRIRKQIKQIIKDTSKFEDEIKLKSIFSLLFSILQLGDDYSSMNFSDFVDDYDGSKRMFDSVLDLPDNFVPIIDITDDPVNMVLNENTPYEYQNEILKSERKNILIFAPCGRGKTEAALLWALQALKNQNKNKIVFAMPTQVTSNAMYDRFCKIFGNGDKKHGIKYVGLFHGKSMIKLKNEEDEEKDISEVKEESFKGNIFFKPITVTTIDHLILSFVHGFSQSDFALGPLQNSVVVFDEVHYYEKQTLDHLVTLFNILDQMNIPHLLMSGTLPEFLIEKVNEQGEYGKPVIDEEGVIFSPFKLIKHQDTLIEKQDGEFIPNSAVIQRIKKEYESNKRIFIICNTVRRTQAFWSILKEFDNAILYHSQYTFGDRIKKEEHILKNKITKPFILVATQTIEISLDISCDIMYSEVAPPDAIGQRAGRLHRGGRNYTENGKEFILHLFRTQDMDTGRKSPYDPDLLELSFSSFEEKPYTYNDIKTVCDSVYEEYGYEIQTPTNLVTFFGNCTLFGSDWRVMSHDVDESKNLQIRSNEYQKISVIPQSVYRGDEANLKIENEVNIPLWLYKKDENESIDDARFFYHISAGKKKYIICRIPYSFKLGFDYDAFFKSNPEVCDDNQI